MGIFLGVGIYLTFMNSVLSINLKMNKAIISNTVLYPQHCLNVLLGSLQYHLHKKTKVSNPKCIYNTKGGLRIHLGVNTLGGFLIFAARRDSALSQQ